MLEQKSKKLIFRLGKIGFLLDLAAIVEIVEDVENSLDSSCSDVGRGIVSAMCFRSALIPVVDPSFKLEVSTTVKLSEKIAIVLHGTEGNWAILVDQIGDVVEVSKFKTCEFPFLFRASAAGYYSQIMLYNDDPYVVYEPEHSYSADLIVV